MLYWRFGRVDALWWVYFFVVLKYKYLLKHHHKQCIYWICEWCNQHLTNYYENIFVGYPIFTFMMLRSRNLRICGENCIQHFLLFQAIILVTFQNQTMKTFCRLTSITPSWPWNRMSRPRMGSRKCWPPRSPGLSAVNWMAWRRCIRTSCSCSESTGTSPLADGDGASRAQTPAPSNGVVSSGRLLHDIMGRTLSKEITCTTTALVFSLQGI